MVGGHWSLRLTDSLSFREECDEDEEVVGILSNHWKYTQKYMMAVVSLVYRGVDARLCLYVCCECSTD